MIEDQNYRLRVLSLQYDIERLMDKGVITLSDLDTVRKDLINCLETASHNHRETVSKSKVKNYRV